MNWKAVCRVEDIPPLGARRIARAGDTIPIAVFRNAEDKVFALLDRCPHKGGPLSQGIVFGDSVACPLHNWTIGLHDGCAKAPDEGCVERFAVRVEDGMVLLPLPRAGEGVTRSTCPYCGVGCGVVIESDGAQITGVRGDADHPANFGRLCSKGSTLHLTASASITRQTRLLTPMRRALRNAAPQTIGWDAALDLAADRIAQTIAAKGPDAIGLYVSGQMLTEDYYVFNKLAKGLIGTNNIDTNSRLCMSSAVAGYKATLGADAPPCSYDDLAHANTVFISGSNLAWAHPILMRRLEDAKRANPQQKWIVVDPRRTETAEAADLHLQILPGTDVALCHGLAHLLLWEGFADRTFIDAHTDGFDALRDAVRNFTPAETAKLCGIKEEALVQAARWFGTHTPTLSLYCQGLNQSTSGTDKNAALINLHLLTGQVGKPGAGPFSLTGQPNAMGGREVGGLANLLSAHRDLANAEHRAEVAALWGVESVPATPGKSAVEMFQAAADGAIDVLWIVCTNPAQSMPDQATVQRALHRCPFVIVQEAYATTATARHADLLLPATTWGEKDGTVTNSERRISRVRAAIAAPGQARDDWRIAVDVAHRLEARLPRRRAHTLFPYDSAEAIWCEHRESTRGRDLDITGLSYALLDHAGPQQWPFPAGATKGQERLYADGRFPTPDGRARFAAVAPRPTAEKRDAHYPFALTTGRLRDQWHGMSRTGTLGRLFGHDSEPVVELHPQDLTRLRVAPGDLLTLKSRRGSVVLPAAANDAVAPAQAFVAMHWGEEFVTGGVNRLTTGAFCPQSKQPELKHATVKLSKADLPWQLAARAWLPAEQALSLRADLMAHAAHLPYAMCVPFGRDDDGTIGIWLRAAAAEAPPIEWLRGVESRLGLNDARALRYADARHATYRSVGLRRSDAATQLDAFLLAGDTRAAPWMSALLVERLPADAYGRALLAGSAHAPAALPARGAQVCTCFDVTAPQIDDVLTRCSGKPEAQLAQLQAALKCGTSCGSCLPALRKQIARQMEVA
jgi:assimilatory nitrate reductase catalytic subunit